MAEGSVWQLRGGLHLSSPGSQGKWSEALRSATATRIKKLIFIQICFLLLLANLPITPTLFEEHVDTKYSHVTFTHIFKEFCHAQHSYISKVTSFSLFYGLSSDLYSRTHERNYAIIYITLQEEISSFTQPIKLEKKIAYDEWKQCKIKLIRNVYKNIWKAVY